VYMVAVSLAVPATRTHAVAPDVLTDIYWSLAVPSDGLSHVRVGRAGDSRIALVLFMQAAGPQQASAAALELSRRVTRTAPYCAQWHVYSASPIDRQ
jgi:hypothetical protein